MAIMFVNLRDTARDDEGDYHRAVIMHGSDAGDGVDVHKAMAMLICRMIIRRGADTMKTSPLRVIGCSLQAPLSLQHPLLNLCLLKSLASSSPSVLPSGTCIVYVAAWFALLTLHSRSIANFTSLAYVVSPPREKCTIT